MVATALGEGERATTMGSPGRGLSSQAGLVALLASVLLLGFGAALLVGPAPSSAAQASSGFSGVVVSLPVSTWALLFLCPLVVGSSVYALGRLRSSPTPAAGAWAVGTAVSPQSRAGPGGATARASGGAPGGEPKLPGLLSGVRTRRRAVAALLVVAALLIVLGVVAETAWTGSSTVTIGDLSSHPHGSGGGQSGSGTAGSKGHGTGNGTGNGTGTGSGSGLGNGTGTGGSGTGSGGPNGTINGTGNGSGNFSTPGNSCGRVLCGPNGTSSGGSGRNNSTGTPRGTSPARGVAYVLPNWVFVLAAVALSAVVGILAMPGMLSRVIDGRPPRGRPRPTPVDPAAWGAVFREARLSVEAGESPRDAIVRLYGILIGRVTASAQELASSTAREIQRNRLLALRVPPASAEAITMMFEEARYSTHPVGESTAVRFVDTMRAIEVSLLGNRTPQ